MAVFPLHVPGRRMDSRPCDGSEQNLLVTLKSTRRLAISAARCSAKRCLSSNVTLVSRLSCQLSHEGLTKLEGGLGHELVPPGVVLHQGSLFGEGRR